MPLLQKITVGEKNIPSSKSFYGDISTQESELTDGISFPRHLPFLKGGTWTFFGSQITEERTKRLNHEVWRQGGTTPLSDLFTNTILPRWSSALPSPLWTE